MKKVVMFYGPPGAGKGTQANLLANKFGMIHFDTGKYIEQVVHNPDYKNDKVVQRERTLFDSGVLCTPSWVLTIVKDRAKRLAKSGLGIVFSGSPRTMFEAFGDKKTEGLLPLLEKMYGKKNMLVFWLDVPEKTSIKRNSNRLVCDTCGGVFSIIGSKLHRCPICQNTLSKRTLDNPRVIKVRLKQYHERTEPIMKKMKQEKYVIYSVNGEALPHEVHKTIIKKLRT